MYCLQSTATCQHPVSGPTNYRNPPKNLRNPQKKKPAVGKTLAQT